MKDADFEKIMEFYNDGYTLSPSNDIAMDFMMDCAEGEVVPLIEVTSRDVMYHKCYMALLNYIYDLLPERFHGMVEKRAFYKWLKHLQKHYKKGYSFLDHEKVDYIKSELMKVLSVELAEKYAIKFGRTDMIEYRSISFGRMTEKKFREYVREQLPYIYENVIGVFYEGDQYDGIIEMIEEEFKKFLSKK